MLFCLTTDFSRAGRAFPAAGGAGDHPPPDAHCQPGAKPLQERSSCRGPLRPALRHPNPLFRHDRRDRLPHRRPGPRRPRPAPPRGRRARHLRRGLLPGQTVRARIIRRQKRFWEARRTAVLEDVALAADICPHGEDCGGCPWQRLPYAAQLRWKGQLVRDALERIGGLGRDAALPLRPALGSPEQRAFRNKMEFAFGPADGSGLCLGLRRRGGLQVLPVPGCALLPAEGPGLVTACAGLAARSGLPAYVPPRSAAEEGRLRPRADKGRGRRPRRERPGAEECGFWRFLVVRCGWPDPAPAQAAAADAPGRRWWLTCVTSPGTAEQRRTVARMGRELLDAFPCVQAFVHEERATPDALVAGERRVLCLDRRGEALPDDEAPLYLPLGGRWFGLDPASFFPGQRPGRRTAGRHGRGAAPLPPAGRGAPPPAGTSIAAPGLRACWPRDISTRCWAWNTTAAPCSWRNAMPAVSASATAATRPGRRPPADGPGPRARPRPLGCMPCWTRRAAVWPGSPGGPAPSGAGTSGLHLLQPGHPGPRCPGPLRRL